MTEGSDMLWTSSEYWPGGLMVRPVNAHVGTAFCLDTNGRTVFPPNTAPPRATILSSPIVWGSLYTRNSDSWNGTEQDQIIKELYSSNGGILAMPQSGSYNSELTGLSVVAFEEGSMAHCKFLGGKPGNG